jgi:hypothetical protein
VFLIRCEALDSKLTEYYTLRILARYMVLKASAKCKNIRKDAKGLPFAFLPPEKFNT